jgi:NADH-quinone oxidoreductase subunit L
MNFLDQIWLIPLFPALGFVINGLLGKRMSKAAINAVACGSVLLSFVTALGAVLQLIGLEEAARSHTVTVFQWINAGAAHTSAGELTHFEVSWGFLLDPLSSVMVLVVSGIGFLIHVYSTGYMAHEDGYYRFFAYLNLFMFSMLTLILGSNYLMLFVGWEGVGLCSYLLIGFFITKRSAGDAAKKAFVVNRVGDWGFSIGIMLIFFTFGTFEFTGVNEAIHAGVASGLYHVGDMIFVGIAIALFVGATGKSAQLPLYVWLPDAMEGPTPVSALIHAATMVTAGVYMVARSNFIYQLAPSAMLLVAVVGALTAFMAASIALVQNDIKRVLAYSTVSQLGYMVLALGVGAFAAGIFHLMTHAFFKALLFLCSGSVIHAMHHEQDMRKMGALRKKIPITFATMAIGTLAIAGTPLLSGFFSKDEILWRTFSNPQGNIVLYLIGVVVAGMTAFYMFRMLFMTFFGESRVDPHVKVHESPKAMTIPLIVLAVGAIFAGYLGLPAWVAETNTFEHFLEPVFEPLPFEAAAGVGAVAEVAEYSHAFEAAMAAFSVAIAFIGFFIAYSMYFKKSDRARELATQYKAAYQALLGKYYVDELYDFLFVNRSKNVGTSLWRFDSSYVDGAVNRTAWAAVKSAEGSGWWDRWVVDGAVRFVGGFVKTFSWPMRLIQTGYVQNYALTMILGVLVFIGYVFLG